jgi:hypothetical protein
LAIPQTRDRRYFVPVKDYGCVNALELVDESK